MPWNNQYSFGIQIIDEQHKHLFDLIDHANCLIKDAREGHDCYDEIMHVLKELESYTIYHFAEEEKLLEAANYFGIKLHKQEHQKFVDKVADVLDSDIDFEQENALTDITAFLGGWVSHHILDTDVNYRDVVKRHIMKTQG